MVQKAKCFTLRAIFHFHPCCLTIAGCLQVPARTPVAKASRVVSFMAGFCLHASCVSCVAAPSRPGLPHQGPARSGSAGWLVQGANPAPDGKALATRGGWDKPTNDPCILSGGTTAQSTYMHDTAQHMSELLETLHGGLPPDNARPGLEPGGGLVSPRAAQFALVSVLSSPLC